MDFFDEFCLNRGQICGILFKVSAEYCPARQFYRIQNKEAYRSGCNELHSKCSCPQGHVGSNPTASANGEKDRTAVFLRGKNRNAGLENLNGRAERGVIRGLRALRRTPPRTRRTPPRTLRACPILCRHLQDKCGGFSSEFVDTKYNSRYNILQNHCYIKNVTDMALINSLSALQPGKRYVVISQKGCSFADDICKRNP